MDVVFYTTESDVTPMVDFIDSLSPKMAAKLDRTIELLEEFGSALRMPHSRLLEDGIYELRVQIEGDATRSLYFFCKGNIAVITHGFVKKTEKTPRREVERAKKYRDDYLKREVDDEV